MSWQTTITLSFRISELTQATYRLCFRLPVKWIPTLTRVPSLCQCLQPVRNGPSRRLRYKNLKPWFTGTLRNVTPIPPPSEISSLDIDKDLVLPLLLPIISSVSISATTDAVQELLHRMVRPIDNSPYFLNFFIGYRTIVWESIVKKHPKIWSQVTHRNRIGPIGIESTDCTVGFGNFDGGMCDVTRSWTGCSWKWTR